MSKKRKLSITAKLRANFDAMQTNLANYHAQFKEPLRFIEIAQNLCNKLWKKYVPDGKNQPKDSQEAELWDNARKYIVELESQCEHGRHLINIDANHAMGIMFHIGMLFERLSNVLPRDKYVVKSKNAVDCMANARRTDEDIKRGALELYDKLIADGELNNKARLRVQKATSGKVKVRTLRSWVDQRKDSQ